MNKRQKLNFLTSISQLTLPSDSNASVLLNILNGKKTDEPYNINNEVKNLLESIEKTYFTPIEREDLFEIIRNLLKLNTGTFHLCKNISKSDIFKISDKTRSLAAVLKKSTEKCLEISTVFEKMPDCKGITQVYFNLTNDFADLNLPTDITLNSADLKIIECIRFCNETIDSIYYSYLKNT